MSAAAMLDARTTDHRKRESLPAYCGIPILDAEGVILGTMSCRAILNKWICR